VSRFCAAVTAVGTTPLIAQDTLGREPVSLLQVLDSVAVDTRHSRQQRRESEPPEAPLVRRYLETRCSCTTWRMRHYPDDRLADGPRDDGNGHAPTGTPVPALVRVSGANADVRLPG